MRHLTRVSVLLVLLLPGRALAQAAVVEILEDDTAGLIAQCNNDGGFDGSRVFRDFRDFYSGVCSVRVFPFQRFSSRLGGWNYQIAEKPGLGQYRYLRFAWKREGGTGIMIQLHASSSWNHRYVAGKASPQTANWGARIIVTEMVPSDWVVVTRDLFKDFGAVTITGMALTPMDGGSGLFDHFYLGRSVEDLDRTSAAVFGKTPLKAPLSRQTLAQLWQDLAAADPVTAGAAVRALVAGRKDSVAFLDGQLRKRDIPEKKWILKLIADLSDNSFKAREAATRELENLGERAEPFLQVAVKEPGSDEGLRRLRALLAKLRPPEGALPPEQARLLRVIRILEWASTPEARRVLERLAGEALPSGLAADARRAVERLRVP
ncbi:MAG TPA: hypothetical protein VEL76_06520 [Gemmataceae bacterium]|nr:hypothetical protein [Gemmataceae bacterium]